MTAAATTDWPAVARELGPLFASRAAAHDAEESFVADSYEDLKRRRLFSAGVPRELGGGGATYGELAAVLRILGRHCASTALALSMHTHQVVIPAWRWRHESAPVEGLLRRIAAEEVVLVSSGGSDWLEGSGRAEQVEGGYRVNARKRFSSGVPSGDLLMTMALYREADGSDTVIHFPINLHGQGVRILDTWHTLGMRGTGSHEVAIEDVFVPDAGVGLRRPAGKWVPVYHLTAMLALPLIYSVYVGIAEAARDIAVREVQRKKDDPDVQAAVGDMETELRLAQIAADSAVHIADTAQPGSETTSEILMRRTLCGQACIRTVEKAMEAVGGASYFRGLGLERLFRDVQAARYHPIPWRAQQRFSGRVALGVDVDS